MKFIRRQIQIDLAAVALAVALGGGAGVSSAAAATAVMSTAEPLKVMSLNVRFSQADDGENSWGRRTGIFFQTIRGFGPDLMGFQEVLADQYDAMIEKLPDYAFSGNARDDGRRKGEWALIGFRRDRFNLAGQGDFWLSEEPSVAGSKSWDSALPRICSWVRLRETATGREYVFANTHFDHVGVIARLEAGKVLSRELSIITNGAPIILTGDFNVTEDSPAYATLVGPETAGMIKWFDAYREVHSVRSPEELSFHTFKGGTLGSRIDFILHTSQFTALEASIVRSRSADGHFPSDHYAVTAVLIAR
jgi:endonuclease/exonuclease/phosphatase family metal-dependent hydrolase